MNKVQTILALQSLKVSIVSAHERMYNTADDSEYKISCSIQAEDARDFLWGLIDVMMSELN
jgi:hypothetical protein